MLPSQRRPKDRFRLALNPRPAIVPLLLAAFTPAGSSSVIRWWLTILVLAPLAAAAAQPGGGQQWFSAWTAALSALVATSMSGTSVRMIVRPAISGNAVRVQLQNKLGQSPVVFSAAYIGQVQSGAALVPGTNTPLTFNGGAGLALAAGADAYSDPVTFQVTAFARYAISLDVTTASDISAHMLGLVTNYMAAGAHGADSTASAFTAIPNGEPDTAKGTDDGPSFPFYWVAALDVEVFVEYRNRGGARRFDHRRPLQYAHQRWRLQWRGGSRPL